MIVFLKSTNERKIQGALTAKHVLIITEQLNIITEIHKLCQNQLFLKTDE